jgi:hypothetical protein
VPAACRAWGPRGHGGRRKAGGLAGGAAMGCGDRGQGAEPGVGD